MNEKIVTLIGLVVAVLTLSAVARADQLPAREVVERILLKISL